MSLINWKKSDFFPSLNALAESFFGNDNDFANWWKGLKGLPAVNIAEGEAAYVMEVAIPGMKKDDFKVEVKEGILTISAESKSEKEEKDTRYTRREFSYSSFSRSFWLPDNIKADEIEANYHEGLLKLTIPKKVLSKPESEVKRIAIS